MAEHLQGLQEHWDIDLLLVHGSKKKSDAAKTDFPFGEIIEFDAPPKGKTSRMLDECMAVMPYANYAVVPEEELKKSLGDREYDAIYTAPMVVAMWADAVAKVLPKRPLVVLNLNDSNSEKSRRCWDLAMLGNLAPKTRFRHAIRSARILYKPRLERKMLSKFDLVFVQTPKDRDAISSDCGPQVAEKLMLAPNGIKDHLLDLTYDTAAEKRLIHIGALVGNRKDILMWFVTQVFVKVRKAMPDVTLHLAGSVKPKDKEFLESIDGITVHGFVEKLEDFLQMATMSVAPMFMRGGLVNKVLDSMAAGVPCSGIKAFNGITGFENGVHGFDAKDAAEWTAMLIEVLQSPERLQQVSQAGRELVRNNCRWETTLTRINERMQSMISA